MYLTTSWQNIYKSKRFEATACEQIQNEGLELLHDKLFLGVVGELVRAEQVAVVKHRQVVDVNLSGLRTKKDCYNTNSQMTRIFKGTFPFKHVPCPPDLFQGSRWCPAGLRNGCADTRPARKPAASGRRATARCCLFWMPDTVQTSVMQQMWVQLPT